MSEESLGTAAARGEAERVPPNRFCFGLLAGLCGLTGSRWLLESVLPAASSTPGSQALGCCLSAAFFGFWAASARTRKRGTREADSPRATAGAIVGTVLVIAGPALGAALSARHIGGNNATLALALTPVVSAVLCGVAPKISENDLAGRLWPGLAGLTGLLLLVPEPALSGWRPWVGLAALPLLMGSGAYLLLRARTERTPIQLGRLLGCSAGCALAGAVALGLMALDLAREPFPAVNWGAACLDGICIVLSLVSLLRLGATRWGAQFLLIPFVAVLESVVLLRPLPDGRSWIGLGLLLVGAARLLVSRSPERAVRLDL